MTSQRYRMSSPERAEILLRLLDLDEAFRATRPLGYDYIRVVDIEHADDLCPSDVVRAVDPYARLEQTWPETVTPTGLASTSVIASPDAKEGQRLDA